MKDNKPTNVTTITKTTSKSVLDCIGTEQWKAEVSKVVPKEMVLDAVLRVARSVAMESKFSKCEPRSFLVALLKCARAGLYPDGREAHLIPFGTECQVIFDWKGLVALASRAGILVTPKLVHQNDRFSVEEDDGTGVTKVLHRVDYRQDRGELVAVYSRARMPDGRVDYEFMTLDEVEQVRQHYSRAKDSPAWTNSKSEMVRKSVIRRHSKRWDLSPELRQAMNADDDSPDFTQQQPKVSTPIFATPPKKVGEIVELALDQTPDPSWKSSPAIALNTVHQLCKEQNIGEGALLEFLKVVGLAQEETSLQQLPEDTLLMVIEQFEDFSTRIKEAT